MSNTNRLGELLVREKLISLAQLRQAQDEQSRSGQNLGYTLARLGFISDQEITNFLSQQYRVPTINLDEYEIDAEILKLVSKEQCEKHRVIPVSRAGSSLIVAMADPTNLHAIDDLKFLTGYNIEPVIASETSIAHAVERYYSAGPSYDEVMAGFDESEIEFTGDDEELNILELEKASEDAPVVRLVNMILLNAIKKGASDIHIEPYEKKLRVRYRVDGVLIEEMTPPLKLKNAISSRLKIMSQLDIAERRLPQDGRIKLKLGKGREMDFRVSVLPTLWGEKIVMRLLDKGNLQLDMTKLGFDQKPLDDFLWAIHQPWGMVLVTGPTGSGKTTTLYSALSDLNKVDSNISTAEDPVEYNLAGINQVQMHDEIGLNFATALRAFLRQDPDIIMVGEIRDFETAEIAVKAALTGHLVLSTLHTNDAPATISRLLNMGVEPFLITASVNLVLAQRLARKVCVDCRQPIQIEPQALKDIGFTAEQIAVAQGRLVKGFGCRTCNGTGYKGRVALYEVMRFTDTLKEMVLQGMSTAELKVAAVKQGMISLRMAGILKILDGVTTNEEILRVTMADATKAVISVTLPAMAQGADVRVNLHQLLKAMVEKGASDMHITAGAPPLLRIDGEVIRLKLPDLTPVDTKQLCYSIMTEEQKIHFEKESELDLSFGVKNLSRFRANVFLQRGAVAGAIRTIPFKILSFDELGLPAVISEMSNKPSGLVLVTGPTGSGKSTTLASIIDKINTEQRVHILTVEDPIEYLHPHKLAVVNQREIGQDTVSFKGALRYVLRQDPDVVLVGEMRDLETIEAALTIAETGHLVFATLHTNTAVSTINRIIDVFPPHQQDQIRNKLSFVLQGVVTQQLLPRAGQPGRCLAMEIMVPNVAIRNLIRENKIHQIYGSMQVGQEKYGMVTLNQSLLNLFMRRFITMEQAINQSTEPEELKSMIEQRGGGLDQAKRPPQPGTPYR